MRTVLLDVDGVLANTGAAIHAYAERWFGRSFPKPETWQSYSFFQALGLTDLEAQAFDNMLRVTDEIGWTITPYPGACAFVETLAAHRDVVFVTAPWGGLKHWVVARDSFLRNHFGRYVDVIYTGAKHRVHGDALLDDHPETILKQPATASLLSRGVLFDRPYNRGPESAGLRRVGDYDAALDVLLEMTR
jgi:5'(3')-deoxyribonucleotidase